VEWVMTITTLNKEAQKKFLEYVIQLLEHLIRFKNIGSQNLVLLESEQKMIEVLIAKGMTDFSIAEISDLLNESIYEIERNANTKILFHSLSLRIQKIVLRKNTVLQH
jgi:DNA polymerase-3 subunit delta'